MSLTNYYEELQKRAAQGKSIRLGMIGFGIFPFYIHRSVGQNSGNATSGCC